MTNKNYTARVTNFTDQELTRMRAYESRTGERIIYSFEDKCRIYQGKDRDLLRNAEQGIQGAIYARLNLDNEDCFDGPDDTWKLKVLEDNLAAIREVLILKQDPTQRELRAAEEADKPLREKGRDE